MNRGATTVEFTRDMADTLSRCFDVYAEDGRVTLELHAGGVWLLDPATGGRSFLGAARPLVWPAQTRHH